MGKENIFMPLKYKRRFERWESEKVKAILMAMFEYKETGEVPKLPPQYLDAFDAIRDDMDIIQKAYEERCRINAENGKKGGRPKKQTDTDITEKSEKTELVLEKAKKALREEKKREEKKRENSLNNKLQDDGMPFYPLKELM